MAVSLVLNQWSLLTLDYRHNMRKPPQRRLSLCGGFDVCANKTCQNKPVPFRQVLAQQHAVDGDIEAVYPFEDSVGVICNEEGKLRGLPANRALRDEDGHIYDVIAGSFLVVGLGEEDFCSLSAEQIDKFEALFHQPEAFVKMGHSITAVPIPDSVLQARDEHRDAPKLTHSSHDDR